MFAVRVISVSLFGQYILQCENGSLPESGSEEPKISEKEEIAISLCFRGLFSTRIFVIKRKKCIICQFVTGELQKIERRQIELQKKIDWDESIIIFHKNYSVGFYDNSTHGLIGTLFKNNNKWSFFIAPFSD